MSYTIAQTNEDRPDAPIYATVEQALLAAMAMSDRPGAGVLVIYDHLTGTPLLLVWQGRAWWP